MSSFNEDNLPPGVSINKCNTCKGIFSSLDKIKDHYRSEWHVFNSKRRSNNLAPLSKDDYKLIAKTLPKSARSSSSSSSSSVVSSATLQSSKASSIQKHYTIEKSNNADDIRNIARNIGIGEDRLDNVVKLALDQEVLDEEMQEGNEEGEEEEDYGPPPVLGANISIFDDKEFETIDECMEYMKEKFGFFIPDQEYLIDRDGLLEYLGEKVKLGGLCLYCQKQQRPGKPCVQHMIDKSHCKIAYQENIDLDEYEDFYDFTASYNEDDEDEPKKVTISPVTGELVLLDGRTVGHRDFKIYYKQHYRPQEERPAVLAQQREEVLKLGAVFGANARTTSEELVNMSDLQVVAMLVKYHKQVRKGQMVEQKAVMRANQRANKQVVLGIANKQRSSETTTAKIRDYHSILM
jgi:pre-60S factor REI1